MLKVTTTVWKNIFKNYTQIYLRAAVLQHFHFYSNISFTNLSSLVCSDFRGLLSRRRSVFSVRQRVEVRERFEKSLNV